MKFSKARYEKWVNKSLEAWINLMQEDPGYPALTKRGIRKWATRLSKADFEIGRMWEANKQYELKQEENVHE